MPDKTFDIQEIIKGNLNDPIPVWGSTELTCADLYNALWEEHCWNDPFLRADENVLKEELSPLVRYLTAILFSRWARQADVDLEDELQKRIDEVFAEDDLSNAAFNPYRPWFCDHNKDEFIFGDEKLSEWLGEVLTSVANHASGFGYATGHPDDELIWMLNERPDNPRPCFKASGWDLLFDDVMSEINLMWHCVSQGITSCIIEREHLSNPQFIWHDEMDWENIESPSDIDKMIDDGKISPSNCAVLVVDNDDWAYVIGYNLAAFLDAMMLVPDEIERFLVFSCDSHSRLFMTRIKEIIESFGFVTFCAPSDQYDIFADAIEKRVKTQYGKRSAWCYVGEVNDALNQRFDLMLSYLAITDMINAMLVAPEGVKELDGSDEAFLAEMSNKSALRQQVIEPDTEEIIRRLTFSEVDASPSAAFIEKNGIFSRLTSVLVNVSEDKDLNISTPTRDMITFLISLYKKEGIFYEEEPYVFNTIYDGGNFSEAEIEQHKQMLEKRIEECVERAERAGFHSAIDAYKSGVPASDILA